MSFNNLVGQALRGVEFEARIQRKYRSDSVTFWRDFDSRCNRDRFMSTYSVR